jgi:hypothetical protein
MKLNNQTKLYLGIGLVAVAGYLLFTQKEKTNFIGKRKKDTCGCHEDKTADGRFICSDGSIRKKSKGVCPYIDPQVDGSIYCC